MFRERLQECRLKKGVSQTTVAQHLNITRQAYNHYETGQRQPTQEVLIKLADYFDVSVDYLLGRADVPNPAESPLDGVEFAFYGEIKDLTDEEREDLADFVKYLKSKRKDD